MMYSNQNFGSILNPFKEIFDILNSDNVQSASYGVKPKVNISESDADYEIALCVPGKKKEDFSISIDTDSNLVIETIAKEEENVETSRSFLRHEFREMKFKQLLSMPENVKREKITAKVEDGILTIVLPKLTKEEKEALAQHIDIL